MLIPGAVVMLLAVSFLLLVGLLAARYRAQRTLDGFIMVPEEHLSSVEPAEPVELLTRRKGSDEADETSRIMEVARRKAEDRAWQVAKEVAEQRAREESERRLFEVAKRMAERRAWQVAMELAKYEQPSK